MIDHEGGAETARYLKALSGKDKGELKAFLSPHDCVAHSPALQESLRSLKELRASIADEFMRCGIFCATRAHSNLLMWAHYADRHKGAVLGFRTDYPDSILGQMKPVSYKDERPSFYQDDPHWLLQTLAMSDADAAEAAYERLLLTKSPQWSYEEEFRLVIPNKVKADESAAFVAFRPEELSQMFFGCRVRPEDTFRLANLARQVNPDIEIYSSKLVRRQYALVFHQIEAP